MPFVVIGTDHRMQPSDSGLEALVRVFLDKQYLEPLRAVAEEYHELLGPSLAQRLAQERGLHWFNLDMTTEEKHSAGILDEQRSRPMFQDGVTFRVASDDIREQAWVKKLESSTAGTTTLAICGYLHFQALVNILRERGHVVDQIAYLEVVPEIRRWP